MRRGQVYAMLLEISTGSTDIEIDVVANKSDKVTETETERYIIMGELGTRKRNLDDLI